MEKPLSKLFEEARSTCVEWQGQQIWGLYEISAPSELSVEIFRSKPSPVQGLCLKAYGGVLSINDIEAQSMLIWTDTAPESVTVRFKSDESRDARLKIWNVWRGKVGGVDVTQAWLGNAGMIVEAPANGKELLLRCSDGEGSVEFSDMNARVIIA